MSKLETPLTRAFWRRIGGTLIEEFEAVQKSSANQRRTIDGIIVLGEDHMIKERAEVNLSEKDIVVVQTKARTLGMYLMGQAFFSAKLMEISEPRSIFSVALCLKYDSVLGPLLECYPNMSVELIEDLKEYKKFRFPTWEEVRDMYIADHVEKDLKQQERRPNSIKVIEKIFKREIPQIMHTSRYLTWMGKYRIGEVVKSSKKSKTLSGADESVLNGLFKFSGHLISV